MAPACILSEINPLVAENENIELTIAPNPFGSYTSIILKNDSKINECNMHIYNGLGKEVLSISITKQVTTLNTIDLLSGIYFYKVMNNNKMIQSGKLISKQ